MTTSNRNPSRARITAHRGLQWFRLRKSTTKWNLLLRTLQLIQGLVVVGSYGTYLNRALKQDKYADGKWVYAVVVGSLASISAICFAVAAGSLHFRVVALCFPWDWMVAVLFGALTGVFGSMYFHERVEMDDDIRKMQVAAYWDAAGLGLWVISAVWTTYSFVRARKVKLRTGKLKTALPEPEAEEVY